MGKFGDKWFGNDSYADKRSKYPKKRLATYQVVLNGKVMYESHLRAEAESYKAKHGGSIKKVD
jgi:hypothetical protein